MCADVIQIESHRKKTEKEHQPTKADDVRQGWLPGDKWKYVVLGMTEIYVCVCNSPLGAVWELLT